ncbi:Flagellar L-ring protein 2 [Vibrio chagasii]|uniref:flagellar basal body L-ring protein FlgH n=1 Tax=Vibrio sp. T3Y01 TaxID=2607606 RepID=UPI000CF3AEF3|nr:MULTISPECIES: flagellar basal body L-ring protein FlgH [Vibrio]MDA0151043.1 flagellar basal body L-ring protein FlgH [Vibrio sp. Makdt]NOI93982.1 flagellar basal body L-ring protein FlgH [Vibrio sp. T3Y01]PQJ51649.1 flagellar basal body L-ring protein [Vibrio splendidus]CAH6841506.1 Flagellar L-ring protein 2 [Vibrio chagasii]CAH6846427.1 Flagellar L-ring protein 2 [Vibrio chagasii]
MEKPIKPRLGKPHAIGAIYYLAVVTLLVVMVAGCAGRQDDFIPPSPNDEAYAPPELDYQVTRVSKGSLYTGTTSMTLFQDRRAYRVGDILTVLLDEKTESDKSASTQYGKDSSANITAPTLGNKTFEDVSASVDATRDFDGAAASKQGNSLSGSITVTVYNVLPNGVLRVRGEKWLKLNQGDEYIRLTGNVRVDDIQADNTLSSQRIADARITYAGRGSFADTNTAGWLTQFFNSPWMPF